jgi:hypothetical protein
MNKVTLQTFKAKENKWWMKMHILFLFLIASQFYLLDHQIQHLKVSSDKVCAVCVVSVDYNGTIASEIILNDNLPVSISSVYIDTSISKSVPCFYFSRAPPILI